MTRRKTEDTGVTKKKYKITLCGELNVEAAMDLSEDRLHN